MPRSNGIIRAVTFFLHFCQFLANGLANPAILKKGFHYWRFAEYDGRIWYNWVYRGKPTILYTTTEQGASGPVLIHPTSPDRDGKTLHGSQYEIGLCMRIPRRTSFCMLSNLYPSPN